MTVEAAFDDNELWQRQFSGFVHLGRAQSHPRQMWDQVWNLSDAVQFWVLAARAALGKWWHFRIWRDFWQLEPLITLIRVMIGSDWLEDLMTDQMTNPTDITWYTQYHMTVPMTSQLTDSMTNPKTDHTTDPMTNLMTNYDLRSWTSLKWLSS